MSKNRPGAKPGHQVSEETRRRISETLKAKPKPVLTPDERAERIAQLDAGRRRRWEEYRIKNLGKPPKSCSVEGCTRKYAARGMCSTHYNRAMNGAVPREEFRQPQGSQNPNWRGGEIGYSAAHVRAKSTLPHVCECCGITSGRLEIALLKNGNPTNYRQSPNGPFSVDPSDYARLCVTCHRRYDSPKESTSDAIAKRLRTTRTTA